MKTPAKDLAACYTRLFKSEDGRRVLADLLAKYPPDRPRFFDGQKLCTDATAAALRDGQSSVIWEITQAIELGRHSADSTTPTPCQP